MIYILATVLYLVGIGATIATRHYAYHKKFIQRDEMDAEVGDIVFSIIGPIYLPILLSYMFFSSMKDWKVPSKELFKGVPKPTDILAGLVAQKVIQNFDKIDTAINNNYYNSRQYNKYKVGYNIYTVNIGNIQVIGKGSELLNRNSEVAFKIAGVYHKDSNDQVKNALKKAIKLKKEKEYNDAMIQQEENALLSIEKL